MKLAKLLCGVALGGLLASNAMAADLLYSSPAPQAMAYGGPYFGAKIGVNWNSSDPSFLTDEIVAPGDTVSLDTGFTGSIVAGYAFGSRWGMLSPRLEVEAGYLNNDVNTIQEDGVGAGIAANGQLNAFYWFTNLLLDIPMSGWGFTPFIGGGVGFANVRLDRVGTVAEPGELNGEDTTFAWNLTAGLSYDISRNVTFDVAYRFVQFNSVNMLNTAGTVTSSDDIDNHQVTAGIRVHL
jgi:opacity protein-like surface antigen